MTKHGESPSTPMFSQQFIWFFSWLSVSDFSFWFSLAWLAAGPSLCLLDIISGIYLAIHVLLGDSHQSFCWVTDGCEFSPPAKRQVGIFVGTCMWFSQKYQKTLLSPFWQLPCPALLLCPLFMPCTVYGMFSGRYIKPGMGFGCFYCATISALFSHTLFSTNVQCAGDYVSDKNRFLAKTLTCSQHSRATNKPLFPADSSPQPCGPCWGS